MSGVVEIARSHLLRRGVTKYRGKILGRNAYMAITSERQLLHGAVYVATDEMDDARLAVWLRRELDRVDPAKPCHLQLVRRTVTPAIDGPSATHPEMMLARVEHVRAETLAPDPAEQTDVQGLITSYPEGHIMRGVCERLSRLLDETA